MSLFIRGHLGAGDALITNGLVRHFALQGRVWFPCKHHNLPSVTFMFRDVPNIVVLEVKDDAEADQLCAQHKGEVLKLGMFGKNFTFVNWSEGFYRQAGISPEIQYSGFYCEREPSSEIQPPPYGYCFLHEDAERNMVIRDDLLSALPIILPEKRSTIFAWTSVIENAEEIHCIDSVFAILADSIPTKAKRPVLHLYARKDAKPPTLRKNWEIIRE